MADPAVLAAFEPDGVVLPLEALVPTRRYRPEIRGTGKYRQIAQSIAAVGLVEPPVVRRDPVGGGYFLLDGHLRVLALRERGETEVMCLLSTGDEAFTYNKRISRLTAAQEHRMIARAVARGVPETLLAAALGYEPKTVQRRVQLLNGIAPEAARLLTEADCAYAVYEAFRRMTPSRQVEAAELMRDQGNFGLPFAQALLAASSPEDLGPRRARRRGAPTRDQVLRLEEELASLEAQVRSLEDHYGLDVLHLTVARGYLERLLGCGPVVDWLAENRPEYLDEFRRIVESARSGGEPLPVEIEEGVPA